MAILRKPLQRIGVLTGGGDCPGLNAVIRVVTKVAINKLGIEVVGVEDGFLGLIEDRMRPLTSNDVSNILTFGGTILGTSNRADPMRFCTSRDAKGEALFENVTPRVIENVRRRELDLLICIGGEGTMTGAANLIANGIPCIGVPKTIDNDLMNTDITFGFTTAVQIATECLDRIHTTGSSHHRIMVVEMMGRNAGWLTLEAGLASGADVILIPEIPFKMDCVCRVCDERSRVGKRFTIVAVSEGACPCGGAQTFQRTVPDAPERMRLGGISAVISKQIQDTTGLESRATVLGHLQRGGTPVAYDRVLATYFGHKAIQMAAMHEWNEMVVFKDGRIGSTPIAAVAARQRTIEPDDPLISMARALNTCVGD
jgi:6-phosphofructokinase 1